ncbi:hypothetical protein [Roseovarius sp. ZX-A-9]|uniref:hypothetical protein n=1 Tax=Roseovarius sp. ZX-A-9 TaxID=3014783 RepID=UPI00232DBBF3|nr:hypothetical protein [Roseovarius sp. ZX-A-9]
MINLAKSFLALLALTLVAACGTSQSGESAPPPGTPAEVAALAASIRALGPEVDPEEASRAAQVAYDYTHTLALRYQITDPPLIHNTKVNMGTKPRGLCWHWAHDLEKRLKEERFQTLDLHRAIANSRNWRIEHSTAIVSAKGDQFNDGIVLDPWRKGGVLTWMPVREDPRYGWEERRLVLERKRGQLPPEAYDAAIE